MADDSQSHQPSPSNDSDWMRVALGDWSDTPPLNENQIGRYRLIELLGEGGFGVVWKAEQTEPIRRHVALKIVKVGMDTARVVERFNAERQTLALMDHPGIAAVFDAGATETGRPYFVMEWVKGTPITSYCDEHDLPVKDRVVLFIEVCRAVQHAHQKGVLHRDLKPTNILVTEIDGQPVPKIIDFGISKVLLAEPTTLPLLQTQPEWLLGTPVYMSPEQAILGSAHLDTRADIYSLGVLLCQLVTGQTPILNADSVQLPVDEIFRRIRHQEPRLPSQMVLSASATEVHCRATSSAQLATVLKGDLDWIVLKALQKDRECRYDSAAALANDLRRHLDHQPVSAGPPSLPLQIAKFARRNRTLVASTTAAFVASLVGAIVATHAYFQESRMRTQADVMRIRAERGEQEAEHQKDLAVLSEQVARAQQSKAEQTLLFLNHLLDETAQQVQAGRNPEALRLALDALCSDLARFGDDPELRESILSHSGRLYRSLGEDHKAIPLLRQQLALSETKHGPTSEITLDALSLYARALSLADQHDLAITANHEIIRRWASTPLDRTQELRTFSAKRDLGSLYLRAGRTDEALAIYETLSTIASPTIRQHPSWVTFRRYHAEALSAQKQHRKALSILRETIADLNLDDPDMLHAAAVLRLHEARSTLHLRDIPSAIRLLEQSIEMDTQAKGSELKELSERWVEVSRLHTLLNQHDAAIEASEHAVSIAASIGDRVQHLVANSATAENLEAAARFVEAAALRQTCAEEARQTQNRPSRSAEYHLAMAARDLALSGQNWPATASLVQRLEEFISRAEFDPSHGPIDGGIKSALHFAQARLAETHQQVQPTLWAQSCLKLALNQLRRSSLNPISPTAPPWKTAEAALRHDYTERSKLQTVINPPTSADLLAFDDAVNDRWADLDPAATLLRLGASLRIAGHHPLAIRAYQTILTIPAERLLVPDRKAHARILIAECLLATRRADLAQSQLSALTLNSPEPDLGAARQFQLKTLQQRLHVKTIADAP